MASGRTLPAELRVQFTFQRGERVMSTGRAHDGRCTLVATDRALRYQTEGNGWSCLGWEQITRVEWDAAAGGLFISSLAGAGSPRAVVPVRDRGTLPELAQERITHTRLGSWRMLLAGGRRVNVEARRRPATGELTWVLTCYDGGLDLRDGDVRAEVRRAIADLGEDLGITHRHDAALLMSDGDGGLPERG
jgi:hypothetical protein